MLVVGVVIELMLVAGKSLLIRALALMLSLLPLLSLVLPASCFLKYITKFYNKEIVLEKKTEEKKKEINYLFILS
jgi:hypothetical protein